MFRHRRFRRRLSPDEITRRFRYYQQLVRENPRYKNFFKRLENQAKKLMEMYRDWDIEVLYPITTKRIKTDIKAMGSSARVHGVVGDYGEKINGYVINGEKVIGYFHTHPGPFSLAEFSKADLKHAMLMGYQVVGVGTPSTGEVKFLLLGLIW